MSSIGIVYPGPSALIDGFKLIFVDPTTCALCSRGRDSGEAQKQPQVEVRRVEGVSCHYHY